MKTVLTAKVGTDSVATILLDGRHIKVPCVAYVQTEPEKRAIVGFYNRNEQGDGHLIPSHQRITSAVATIRWDVQAETLPIIPVASAFMPSYPEADRLYDGCADVIGELKLRGAGVFELVFNADGLRHLQDAVDRELSHLPIGFVIDEGNLPGESFGIGSDIELAVAHESKSEGPVTDAPVDELAVDVETLAPEPEELAVDDSDSDTDNVVPDDDDDDDDDDDEEEDTNDDPDDDEDDDDSDDDEEEEEEEPNDPDPERN